MKANLSQCEESEEEEETILLDFQNQVPQMNSKEQRLHYEEKCSPLNGKLSTSIIYKEDVSISSVLSQESLTEDLSWLHIPKIQKQQVQEFQQEDQSQNTEIKVISFISESYSYMQHKETKSIFENAETFEDPFKKQRCKSQINLRIQQINEDQEASRDSEPKKIQIENEFYSEKCSEELSQDQVIQQDNQISFQHSIKNSMNPSRYNLNKPKLSLKNKIVHNCNQSESLKPSNSST